MRRNVVGESGMKGGIHVNINTPPSCLLRSSLKRLYPGIESSELAISRESHVSQIKMISGENEGSIEIRSSNLG